MLTGMRSEKRWECLVVRPNIRKNGNRVSTGGKGDLPCTKYEVKAEVWVGAEGKAEMAEWIGATTV